MAIHLDDAFQLAVPPEEAWQVLNDVPRIAHCLPGASAIQTVGPNEWTARVTMKVGPLAMEFDATIHSEHISVDERTARMTVIAEETKGKGAAKAIVVSSVTPDGDGASAVSLSTDVTFQGAMGRHLRGPMVTSVSRQMTARFARCLQQELAPPTDSPAEKTETQPRTTIWSRALAKVRSWSAAIAGSLKTKR